MLIKRTICIIIATFCLITVDAQQYRSFELRYFSNDPKADGETDFKGPTSVFDTEKRVEFLKTYAAFASDFVGL